MKTQSPPSLSPRPFSRPSARRRVVYAAAMVILAGPLVGQVPWPYAPPPPMVAASTTGPAQRNALNGVRSQVDWLQNATRTARNYTTGGAGMVWDQFQKLRGAYAGFKMTLNPRQLSAGANDLAELDAGLDILQEAFGNYQQDVGSGRSESAALSDLCQVLRQASTLWLQELNRDSSRLRVGF